MIEERSLLEPRPYEWAVGQTAVVTHPAGMIVEVMAVGEALPGGVVVLADGTRWRASGESAEVESDLRISPIHPAIAKKLRIMARFRRIAEMGRIVATFGDVSTPLTEHDLEHLEDAGLRAIRGHSTGMPPEARAGFLRAVGLRLDVAADGAIRRDLYVAPRAR